MKLLLAPFALILAACSTEPPPDGLAFERAALTQISADLDLGGTPVTAPAYDYQSQQAIAYGGGQFFAVWSDFRAAPGTAELYGARISASGAVLDPAGIPIAAGVTTQFANAIAFDGTNFLVVWEKAGATSSEGDLYATRVVAATGAVLDPAGIRLTSGAKREFDPAVDFDGTNFFVVWNDMNGAQYAVYGTRVSRAGAVLDPQGVRLSGSEYTYAPVVAWDGSQHLVAWSDYRGGSDYDVYAARVSRTGAALDLIAVATGNGRQENPAVAYDGQSFVVAWQDGRATPTHVYANRINAKGKRQDGNGVQLTSAAGGQTYPRLAFDGTNHLLVWTDARQSGATTAGVFGARVTPRLARVDAADLAISPPPAAQVAPDVACGGGQWLAVWFDQRLRTADSQGSTAPDIYGARVAKTGAVLDPAAFAVATAANAQHFPAVAGGDDGYLAAWEDLRTGQSRVWGTRFDLAGAPVGDAFPIALSGLVSRYAAVAPGARGNYLVVWQAGFGADADLWAARVRAADGVVLDPGGVRVAATPGAGEFMPAVAFDGTSWLVVWTDGSASWGSTNRVAAARVIDGAAGLTVDAAPLVLASGTNTVNYATVAGSDDGFLVAWSELAPGVGYDVLGARVREEADGSATVLDPEGVAIAARATSEYAPIAAFDGTNYLVAWSDYRASNGQIFAARVATSAFGPFALLGPDGLGVAPSAASQAAAALGSDGAGALLVWRERATTTGPFELHAARLVDDGTLFADPAFLLSTSPAEEGYPAVAACAPGDYAVVHDPFVTASAVRSNRVRARLISF